MKPYKGEIHSWRKVEFVDGFIIMGKPIGHPQFVNWIRTSKVEFMKDSDGYWEVETLNSRYHLPYCEKADE